ncbi:MAG TPA: hypothetical protein VFW12_00715 [Candidatus Limnocylindria bacterium]|nr:hypothetical protein [Candidatus Limnocylindria bacterium]
MPPIAWNPVLAGSALALLVTLAGAPLIGVAAGGALAGRFARIAPAYQGALVAIAAILALAVLPVAGPDDTVLILVTDAALLAVGAASAFVASRFRGPGG